MPGTGTCLTWPREAHVLQGPQLPNMCHVGGLGVLWVLGAPERETPGPSVDVANQTLSCLPLDKSRLGHLCHFGYSSAQTARSPAPISHFNHGVSSKSLSVASQPTAHQPASAERQDRLVSWDRVSFIWGIHLGI